MVAAAGYMNDVRMDWQTHEKLMRKPSFERYAIDHIGSAVKRAATDGELLVIVDHNACLGLHLKNAIAYLSEHLGKRIELLSAAPMDFAPFPPTTVAVRLQVHSK